jgi:predicted amidophosphoribosyltransferase
MTACPWCATALDRGRCRSCSKQLEPDWRICPWCRTPAAAAPPQQFAAPVAAPVAAAVAAPVAVQAHVPAQAAPPGWDPYAAGVPPQGV